MNNIMLPGNHCFLQSSRDTSLLCHSLYHEYGINMFVYGRYYLDGSSILLSSNEDWLQYHLSQGYLVPAPVPSSMLKEKEAFHIIPGDGKFAQAKHDLIHRYNTDQAVDYIVKGSNYVEVICFSFCADEKNALNVMINNLSNFKRFTEEFKDKMALSLRHAEKNRITLPEEMRGIRLSQLQNYLPITNLNKSHAKSLTPRQLDILRWIVKGKTANETALKLGMSRRTVEHHLMNLKIKMDACSKSELIERSMQIFDENNYYF